MALKTAKLTRGNPVLILILFALITAGFSALLDNVTTVLILTPITILIAVELGISPIPFVISDAIASNIGGTATLIGDPPNIMIGSAAGLSFMDFLVNLTPFILLFLGIYGLFAWWLFGRGSQGEHRAHGPSSVRSVRARPSPNPISPDARSKLSSMSVSAVR